MKTLIIYFHVTWLVMLTTSTAFGQWQNNAGKIYYNNGNVGIGTNNPSYLLDVYGAIRAPSFRIKNTTTNDGWRFNTSNNGQDLELWTNPDMGDPQFRMRFNQNGNVGIGIDAPEEKLDVDGTIKAKWLKLGFSPAHTEWFFVTVGGNDLLLKATPPVGSPINLFHFTQSGNVGIGLGNGSPSTRLHVSGADNNGTAATLKISSGTQNMLIDGNEIDGDQGLYLNNNNQTDVILATGGGNVGIGTNAPGSKLHIVSPNYARMVMTATTPANDVRMFIDARGTSGNERGQWGTLSNHDVYLYTNSMARLVVKNNGSVGIGTTTPSATYKLSVNGKIRAKEIVVETGWADFVFDKDYALMPLEQVEAFIQEHQHLPEIPAAQTITEQGVSVGEIASKLLRKVEELTLYMISLKKENDDLKYRISEIEAQTSNQIVKP